MRARLVDSTPWLERSSLNFVQFLLIALWVLVFGRMLMSWVDPAGRNQVSTFLFQATEPILAPGPPDAARRPA